MDNKTAAVTSPNCCRLCLLDDGIKLPIFEGEGVQRQVAHKIQTCFPILVIFMVWLISCVYKLPFVVVQDVIREAVDFLCCVKFIYSTTLPGDGE
jgi:hypothetical protein